MMFECAIVIGPLSHVIKLVPHNLPDTLTTHLLKPRIASTVTGRIKLGIRAAREACDNSKQVLITSHAHPSALIAGCLGSISTGYRCFALLADFFRRSIIVPPGCCCLTNPIKRTDTATPYAYIFNNISENISFSYPAMVDP